MSAPRIIPEYERCRWCDREVDVAKGDGRVCRYCIILVENQPTRRDQAEMRKAIRTEGKQHKIDRLSRFSTELGVER